MTLLEAPSVKVGENIWVFFRVTFTKLGAAVTAVEDEENSRGGEGECAIRPFVHLSELTSVCSRPLRRRS